MLKYGTDKPDLRNPIEIADVTEIFKGSGFSLFASLIEKGATVRAISAPTAAKFGRSFFDKKNDWAREEGAAGMGYIIFSEEEGAKGPIAKQLDEERLTKLKQLANVKDGDGLFFACDTNHTEAAKLAGKARILLGDELELLEQNTFKFCWIIDFPYYEWSDEEQHIDFSHNPFSMPQGGLEAIEKASSNEELLDILAYQYDIVCNGVELSSGAIRNHQPDLMYKAFEIVGYTKEQVDQEFGGMIRAFTFGAPPHGGIAPGVDRMVMLLANEPNIREVVAFPMNQQAEDLLMGAPAPADPKHLRELHIQLSHKAKEALEAKQNPEDQGEKTSDEAAA